MIKEKATENKTEPEPKIKEPEPKFHSSFKAWIRVVAFVVVAVFLPEQVAQAVEYDWRVLWNKPAAYTSPSLGNLRQVDIPLSVRNILKDIAGKPITEIRLSPEISLKLNKPLKLSAQRIDEIYSWLKGKPCGSKALYDFLIYKGLRVEEQDIAVMALTIDILNEVVKPEGNPKIIKNSLYALSQASEFFGHKLVPVKRGLSPQGTVPFSGIVPFIAHLKGDHYILVTRIANDKVYFSDEHKEEFLPQEKFLQKFSGYALVLGEKAGAVGIDLIADKEAMGVKGAGEDDVPNYQFDNYTSSNVASDIFYGNYGDNAKYNYNDNSYTPPDNSYSYTPPSDNYVLPGSYADTNYNFNTPSTNYYASVPSLNDTTTWSNVNTPSSYTPSYDVSNNSAYNAGDYQLPDYGANLPTTSSNLALTLEPQILAEMPKDFQQEYAQYQQIQSIPI